MIKFNHSFKTGISFGLTSGIVTTLGLMMGLYSSTNSKMVVIVGILTIAFADSLSDAAGIHISEESENKHSVKEIWQSTFFTFLAKLIFTLTFLIPVLIFSLNLAIYLNMIYGLFVLIIFSFFLAKSQNKNKFSVILEHLILVLLVLIITHYLGKLVNYYLG